MPVLSILHGVKNSVNHFLNNIRSSKILNRIRKPADVKKHTEETTKQVLVSSNVSFPQREKESTEQKKQTSQIVAEAAKDEGTGESTPDVLLDIPILKIDELKLNLDDLDAQVALQSDLGKLIRINIGAHASIKKLDLDLKGVDAKAVLKVRLKDVYKIFSRAFDSLDSNPDISNNLISSAKEEAFENSTMNLVGNQTLTDDTIAENPKDTTEKVKTDNPLLNNASDSIEIKSNVNSEKTRLRFREDK